MSDPTIVVGLLQQTLGGTTESIKKAEASLQQLQRDQSLLTNLMLIIREPSVHRDVRKAAALYTKKVAKARLIEKDQNKINATAEALLSQLSVSASELVLRRHIAASLEYLLMNDQRFVLREKLNPLCIKMLEEGRAAEDGSVNYEFLGFFAQVLMTSFVHLTKQQNTFMQATISLFSQLNLRVLKHVSDSMAGEDRHKIVQMLKILKLYSYTFKIYMRKMLLAELQTVKLLYDEHITLLVSASLSLALKNNELSTNLIYFNPQADQEIVGLFHSVKADYVQAVGCLMRAVFMQFKDKQMIAANAILSSPALLPNFISSVAELLCKTPYYQIRSPSLVKLLEEIIHCEIYAARNPFYFQHFSELKEPVVHGCILKVLQFSQADYDSFFENPDQFINQLLQIIEMDSAQYLKNKDRDPVFSDQDEIEEYSNLRTLAATLLQALCKHIDGSLPEILSYSMSVLQSKVESQFPKSILLLMLSILRGQILERESETGEIIPTICSMLKASEIPIRVRDPENTPPEVYQANIEYLVTLLAVFRFLNVVPEVAAADIQTLYQLVHTILVREDVSTGLQYEAFDLVTSLCQRSEQLQIKFVELFNSLLASKTVNKQKCLETLPAIFSNPSQALQNRPDLVSLTVKHMCSIVFSELQKKTNFQQLIVNKCWNVISGVYQSSKFIPLLIPQIEEAVLPLLAFIDGKNNYDFEEDIFMMMSSFIEKSKTVTQNQLVMFEIIPKLFYSQYEYRFGHAFETLHIFILYGKDILAVNPQAIKAIIEMAVCNMNTTVHRECPRNESQNCEGVIIIQSLILSCGNVFTQEVWVELAKALSKRLESPAVKGHILHSNILASLALILMMGSKFFRNEDCEVLLTRILQNYYCFVVKYSIKIVIIAFSELLCQYSLPFVSNRFALLLDSTVTLLESHEKKELFNKNPMSEEERDYDICLQTTKNAITDLDETDYFKKKFMTIKQHNGLALTKAIAQLPQGRQKYLQKVVNTILVNNEPRPIFKIKKS